MRRGNRDPAIAAVVAAIAAVLCVASSSSFLADGAAEGEELTTQLSNGFTAAHAAGTAVPFEPVLYAPSGAFALGFLRVGAASLDLAVVHLPSSFPVWRATPARLGDWSRPATLTFRDGSLQVLLLTGGNNDSDDGAGGVLWRTSDAAVGDVVELLDSSNLVVRRHGTTTVPEWESFRHPSDTLVLGQNFTGASPPLVSANRRFALRLGKSHMALHMVFDGGRTGTTTTAPVYWKHTAMEARPENGTEPPVYGRLDGRGFFGLYLEAGRGGEERVDVLSFDTFAQDLTAGAFRRMTLEDDGNLRAYYWATTGGGGSMAWTSDYRAISERCDLPTPCGAYGLCVPGKADECQCLLDNSTSAAGAGAAPSCHAEETADLCAGGTGQEQEVGMGFDVVRRKRVSVAYKEELPVETNRTAEECEAACAGNCSCWAALHSGGGGGGGGYCYLIDFPVETMVYEADDRKVGYFKIRRKPTTTPASTGVAAATAALSMVLVGLATAGACVIGYRIWERRKRRRAGMEQELVPVPYMDLNSMDSYSSNNSFRA